jgi:hypothetical protein
MTKLTPDYGFDFIGQPLEATKVTTDFVLFQVKSRDRPLSLRPDGTYAVRIRRVHADLWKDVPVPVFLVVVEVPSRRIFLTNARQSVQSAKSDTASTSALFREDALLDDACEHRLRAAVNAYWSTLRKVTGPAAAAMAATFGITGAFMLPMSGMLVAVATLFSALFTDEKGTPGVLPSDIESFKRWLRLRLAKTGGA